ncbi:LysR family transcriptional regulator [Acrocarpospora macrocephala]|uniref:LysR family transcriptional regulator n=1 Tax=Acrocarpospora macrocephala TaxID=150177 RepID=UPI001478182E|nr:LysR family transcriptional regulator [Acrocarpospora macrocephala]
MKGDLAEHLRLLALIEEHGTLAAASDVLELSPAAVTQRLARAEELWGVALVERGPRGAHLTPAGQALARHGSRIEREVAEATHAFAAYRQGLVRRLRVGAFQAAALHLLPPAMTALRHRVPDVDLSAIDLQSSDALGLVAGGDLDLAVLASWDVPPAPAPEVDVVTLLEDPMVVVFADDHRLAGSPRPVALADLAEESWVVIRGGTAARHQFDRVTHEAGFDPRIRFETESYDVAQALVGTGYGVALVSRMALRPGTALAHRPLAGTGAHRTIHAATPHGDRATPLAVTFRDLLADVARDLASVPLSHLIVDSRTESAGPAGERRDMQGRLRWADQAVGDSWL